MKLQEAFDIATEVCERLSAHCEDGFLNIAGSIRRCKPEVKDIEIVCIPKPFEIGLFETGFAEVVNQWQKIKGEPTGKYTQRKLPSGMMLYQSWPRNFDSCRFLRHAQLRENPIHDLLSSARS